MVLRYFRNAVMLEKESITRSMQRSVKYARGIAIDIGCGEKPYENIFRPHVERYYGFDVDPEGTKNVDVCANSLRLPVRSESVDTVISNQVIEHVEDPAQFMSEVGRILRPGGVAIITAPQLWCLHEKPYDFYRFTRYALELLSRTNGMEVVLLEERYGAFAAIAQMISLMIYLPQAGHRFRVHLVRPLFGLVQLTGVWLDRLFHNPDLTLGYLLVAKKHSNNKA